MRMSILSLAILCGLPALTSCSMMSPQLPDAPRIEPVLQVSGSRDTAAGLFQLGKVYQGQNRLAQAEEAFRKALALNVDFVEARSALGTLYARQGKYDEAIEEYTAVLGVAPQLAQIYNNLGYTYFLQGRHQAAVEALQKATALEPGNARAFNNLAAAYQKLGRGEDARRAAGQAQALHAGQAHRDVRPPGNASGRRNSGDPGGGNGDIVLPPVAAGPSVDITLPVPAARSEESLPPLSVATPEKTTPDRSFRFEIANGNGVPGLARRFRDALLLRDLPKAGLSNRKPYQEKNTVIEYRPGHREEALRLRQHVGAETVALLENVQRQEADVRLVLGHDLALAGARNLPLLAKAGTN